MEIVINQLKKAFVDREGCELYVYNDLIKNDNDKTEILNKAHSYDITQILTLVNEKDNYKNELKIPEIYTKCVPIALFKIKKNIKIPMVEEGDEMIHILQNESADGVYICVSFSHPFLWYSVSEQNYDNMNNAINNIIKTYNPADYTETYSKEVSGYIGNESMTEMTENDLLENLIIGEWNELFMWGNLWEDHPFRETLKNEVLSQFQYSKINIYAMQQTSNRTIINVKTQLSKSHLKFILQDDLYYVTIKYNPLENNNILKINDAFKHSAFKQYPSDVPIDVIQTLIYYSFITYQNVLELRPLTATNFIIVDTLINNDLIKINYIMSELRKIMDECITNNAEKMFEVVNGIYETYAIKIVLNDILVPNNLGLSKDVIKQRCIESLLKDYSVGNTNVNTMIEKAYNNYNNDVTLDTPLTISTMTSSSEISSIISLEDIVMSPESE